MRGIQSWRVSGRLSALIGVLVAATLAAGLLYVVKGGADGPPLAGPAEGRAVGDTSIPLNSVVVTGQAVPADTYARAADISSLPPRIDPLSRVRRSGPDSTPYLQAVTPLLDVGPSGPLTSPLTISFTLVRPVGPEDQEALTALHNLTGQPEGWQSIPYQLSPDRKVATVTVDHLSLFTFIITSVRNVAGAFLRQFDEDLTGGAFIDARPPTCPDEAGARRDGYTDKATFSAPDAVFYCFGYDAVTKDRVVTLVNNRRYPLELAGDKVAVIDNSVINMSFAEIYRQFGHVVLMPRDSITYQINPLPEGERAHVDARLSNWALGLVVLDRIFDVVSNVFLDGGEQVVRKVGEKSVNSKEIVELLETSTECLGALEGQDLTVGKIIKFCLSPRLLAPVLGTAVALLLAPVTIALQAADTARGFANALADRGKGRDRYSLAISRAKSSAVAPPGHWSRRGAQLAISVGGHATIEYQLGSSSTGCDVTNPAAQGQFCYLNADLTLTPTASPGAYTGRISRTWFTDVNDTPLNHSDYTGPIPEVGSAVTFTIDTAADKALYRDKHGPIDFCGSNTAVPKQSCS